jgi:hypothetical protein
LDQTRIAERIAETVAVLERLGREAGPAVETVARAIREGRS